MTRNRAGWIATLVSVAMLSSGCFVHEPRSSMYDEGARAAPPPGTAPDGTPLTGSMDDGIREGEEAAEDASVAGYFVLGAVTAPLVVLCIIGLANSKGGGGGDCGGGGGGGVSTGGGTAIVVAPQYVPVDSQYRTQEFVTGYNQGYETRLKQRQGTAFGFGFLTGAIISAVAVGIWLTAENNRDKAENEVGNHAGSGGGGGRPTHGLIEF